MDNIHIFYFLYFHFYSDSKAVSQKMTHKRDLQLNIVKCSNMNTFKLFCNASTKYNVIKKISKQNN